MKRIRITSDGKPGGTKVVDADTGETIHYVKRVIFEHDAQKSPRVTLEIVTGIDGAEISLSAEQIEAMYAELPPGEECATVASSFSLHRPLLPLPPDNEPMKRGG